MTASEESNLYFAFGPRHVFLATGYALHSDARHHLYVEDGAKSNRETSLADLLEEWPSSPFTSIHKHPTPTLTPGINKASGRAKRAQERRVTKSRREMIKRLMGEVRPRRVFVGTDSYKNFQYALSLARRCNPAAECIYLEDGTAAYAQAFGPRSQRRRNRCEVLLKKLRHGWFWQEIHTLGTSTWIDRALLAFPDLALPALSRKKLERLAVSPYRSQPFTDFVAKTAESFGADLTSLEAASSVVILTKASVAALIPGYAETIRSLCQGLVEQGHLVLLKHHPREQDMDFLTAASMNGCVEVPPGLPFEFLLPLIDHRKMTIFGDVSTTLLASKWLCPELRVRAMRFTGSQETSNYLREVYAALKIPQFDSVAEILTDYDRPRKEASA